MDLPLHVYPSWQAEIRPRLSRITSLSPEDNMVDTHNIEIQ